VVKLVAKSWTIEHQREYFRRKQKEYNNTPYGQFRVQRTQAKSRKIEWLLTFDKWLEIWMNSGHYHERGTHSYVMCRKGDVGPYSEDNVYIAHFHQNLKDAHLNGCNKKNRHYRKISPLQREDIIELCKYNIVYDIAKVYNIHSGTVYSIIRDK